MSTTKNETVIVGTNRGARRAIARAEKATKSDTKKTTRSKKSSKTAVPETNAAVDETKAAAAAVLSLPTAEEMISKDAFEYVPFARIANSSDIQRLRETPRVKDIVDHFNPRLVNVIKVSERDGRLYVFDGAHTLAAICEVYERLGITDFPVLCRVYHDLTERDEAYLFALQDSNCKPVQMPFRIRALEKAEDPEIVDFLESTRTSGFSISPGVSKSGDGHVSAVCAALKAFRRLGGVEYRRMLQNLRLTWMGESWSVTQDMLGGVSQFMEMYEFRDFDFISIFRQVSQADILAEAAKYAGKSKAGAIAAAIAWIFERVAPGKSNVRAA